MATPKPEPKETPTPESDEPKYVTHEELETLFEKFLGDKNALDDEPDKEKYTLRDIERIVEKRTSVISQSLKSIQDTLSVKPEKKESESLPETKDSVPLLERMKRYLWGE